MVMSVITVQCGLMQLSEIKTDYSDCGKNYLTMFEIEVSELHNIMACQPAAVKHVRQLSITLHGQQFEAKLAVRTNCF